MAATSNEGKSKGRGIGGGVPRLPTYFAPPERASSDEVAASIAALAEHQITSALMDTVGGFLMILNEQRQILVANAELLGALDIDSGDGIAGKRVGEALGCLNAWDSPSGCGTSERCAACGSIVAILGSGRLGGPIEKECLLTLSRNGHPECHEFRVKATPLEVGDEVYTVLSFRDVSSEKRREVLEQTFFHDMLDTIGGLYGYARLLKSQADGDTRAMARKIAQLGDLLRRGVEEQRALMEAENGLLELHLHSAAPAELAESIASLFDGHDAVEGKQLVVDPPAEAAVEIRTDPAMVERVLLNMVKNALEATEPGGTARMWIEQGAGRTRFFVHNAEAMTQRVAKSVFQRSFTTKEEKGRGLGTYSMKLFGEQYLGGEVGFTSEPGQGTTFVLDLPDEGPSGKLPDHKPFARNDHDDWD